MKTSSQVIILVLAGLVLVIWSATQPMGGKPSDVQIMVNQEPAATPSSEMKPMTISGPNRDVLPGQLTVQKYHVFSPCDYDEQEFSFAIECDKDVVKDIQYNENNKLREGAVLFAINNKAPLGIVQCELVYTCYDLSGNQLRQERAGFSIDILNEGDELMLDGITNREEETRNGVKILLAIALIVVAGIWGLKLYADKKIK